MSGEREGSGRFYVRGMRAPIRLDETHELRYVQAMSQASARTLENIACSLLNKFEHCIITYGINRNGFVRGVILDHRDKQRVRAGVEFVMGNLRPQVPSTRYGVEFVPVLRSAADPPESAALFVVEVWVCGDHRCVYTTWVGDCYLRKRNTTYQAFAYEVRAWVAQMEEARYRKAAENGEEVMEYLVASP